MTLRPGTTLNKLEHRFIRRLPYHSYNPAPYEAVIPGLTRYLSLIFFIEKIPGYITGPNEAVIPGLTRYLSLNIFSLPILRQIDQLRILFSYQLNLPFAFPIFQLFFP